MPLKPEDVVGPNGLTAYDLMMRPCKTREELQNWFITFLEFDPPDQIVDPESTSTPLDMAWRVYSNALWWRELKPEQKSPKMLFFAARTAFKTMTAAATEFVVLLHDKRSVTHAASTQAQAIKAYAEYFKLFLDKPIFEPIRRGIRKNTATQCVFENGTQILVVPCTRRAVQGPHSEILVRDEIDVVEDVRAYYDLDGIPVGTHDKRPPIDFGISVRKSGFGMVQREIDAIEKGEKESYLGHWNLIDVTEKCPDSRSGTTPVTLYVKENTMHYLDQAGFEALPDNERRYYLPKPALDGCKKNCRLFAACLTNLKRQESKSAWLKPIDDAESLMKKSEDGFFIASYLCRKPPSEGLVYTRFDEKNIKSYREMYEVFAGEPWPQQTMSLDDFIGVMKRYGVHCVAGIDWGFTNPSVCLVMYIDSRDNVYVVYAMSRTGVDDADFVRMIAEDIQPRFNVQLYFPDIENPSAIKMMIGRDLPVSKKVDKTKGSVYNGIQIVKSFITVPGTNKAKLFVTRENGADGLITEMGKYHHKTDAAGRVLDDEYEDAYNHHEDALRYPLNTIYGKFQVHLAVSGSEDAKLDEKGNPKPPEVPSKDDAGNFFRAPTAAELAETLGIPFVDNRDEVAKRNQPKDPKDEGKGGGGSSGTFSWSF